MPAKTVYNSITVKKESLELEQLAMRQRQVKVRGVNPDPFLAGLKAYTYLPGEFQDDFTLDEAQKDDDSNERVKARFGYVNEKLEEPDFVLGFDDLYFSQRRWVIYAWRRGKEILYIGSSTLLWGRIANHHVIGKVEAFRPGDELWVIECSGKDQCRFTEQELIGDYRPKYNIMCKGSDDEPL